MRQGASAPAARRSPTHSPARYARPLQLRNSGPGGAYLLYTTRQHTLHTQPVDSCLAAGGGPPGSQQTMAAAGPEQWQQPAAQAAQQAQAQAQQKQQQQQQGFMASMRAAMRPTGPANGAAAAGVMVRSVEQNALLVAVPPGERGAAAFVPASVGRETALLKQCLPASSCPSLPAL